MSCNGRFVEELRHLNVGKGCNGLKCEDFVENSSWPKLQCKSYLRRSAVGGLLNNQPMDQKSQVRMVSKGVKCEDFLVNNPPPPPRTKVAMKEWAEKGWNWRSFVELPLRPQLRCKKGVELVALRGILRN